MSKTFKRPPRKVPEIELSYKPKLLPSQRISLTTLLDTVELVRDNWDSSKICLLEQLKILLLDRAFTVIGIVEISRGGTASTTMDPRIVFATALKANASAIMIIHNHPSGSLTPSESDKELTRNMVNLGDLLGIFIVDHIILTAESFFSFYQNGLIKNPTGKGSKETGSSV